MEPVSWHCSSPTLLAELLHSFRPKVVFRCPESDHLLILEAIKQKIPVVSIVWSSHHEKLLKQKCLKALWQCMVDPNCPDLYEVQLILGGFSIYVCQHFLSNQVSYLNVPSHEFSTEGSTSQ